MNDTYVRSIATYLPLNSALQSEFQDLFSVVVTVSPEITYSITDFSSSYIHSAALDFLPTALTDSYTSNLNFFVSEGVISALLFFLYV